MPSPDEYARTLTKQAISRAALALGFQNAQADVLHCLGDVLAEIIQKLARESLVNSEFHGRAQPGLQDTLQALECLRPLKSEWIDLRDFAFPELTDAANGNSNINANTNTSIRSSRSSSSSNSNSNNNNDNDNGNDTTNKNEDIAKLIAGNGTSSGSTAWRQPFPYDVPNFPVSDTSNTNKLNKTDLDKIDQLLEGGGSSKGSHGSHVPEHLPAYPPQHTYPNKKRLLKESNNSNSSSRKRAAIALKNEKELQKLNREAGSSISRSLTSIEDCADMQAGEL